MREVYSDVRSTELAKMGGLVSYWELTINGKVEGTYYTLTDLLHELTSNKLFPIPVMQNMLDEEPNAHVDIQIKSCK